MNRVWPNVGDLVAVRVFRGHPNETVVFGVVRKVNRRRTKDLPRSVCVHVVKGSLWWNVADVVVLPQDDPDVVEVKRHVEEAIANYRPPLADVLDETLRTTEVGHDLGQLDDETQATALSLEAWLQFKRQFLSPQEETT